MAVSVPVFIVASSSCWGTGVAMMLYQFIEYPAFYWKVGIVWVLRAFSIVSVVLSLVVSDLPHFHWKE